MKAILKKFWLYLPIVLLFGAVGCNDDEPIVKPDPASIAIENVTTTSSSVKFTLTPQKAVRYTYEVALEGETGTVNEIANGEASTQEVKDLEADKAYFIKAIAYNESGEASEEARHEFRTTALASVAINESIEVTVSSAKVTFVPTNATSFSYACYETANKPAELQWTKIEGNETYTAEIKELADDTDYTVEAFATNAEGDSEHQIATFKTLALPTLEMTLNAEELKAHSAKLTFTPANAEGFAYAYYKAEERPEEPVFVPVTAAEETVVTLNRLTANTAYTVEAYAFSGDYKTEPITLEVTTPESTEGLETIVVNNGKVAYVEMYFNPEKITGYFYATQFYEEGGYPEEVRDEASWWKFEQDNAWWGLEVTKKDHTMMTTGLVPNKSYAFYTIEQVDGQWDESTIRKHSFKTGSSFSFAAAEPEVTYVPGAINIVANTVCADDAVVLLSCCAPKADVEAAEGGIEGYFSNTNRYVSRMIDVPAMTVEHPNLAPRSDYYVMTATLNRDGSFSKINAKEVKTLAVETVDVDTEVELASVGFVNATLNFSIEYADAAVSQIRYKYMEESVFNSEFNGDEELVADALFGGVSSQSVWVSSTGENVYGGNTTLTDLTQGTAYKVFATPILPEGRFGKVTVLDFSTNSIGKLDGTAKSEIFGGFNLSTGEMVFTFVPDDNCKTILYKVVQEAVFTQNRFDRLPMKLAENIAGDAWSTKIIADPSDESQLSGSNYYSRNSIEGNYVIALVQDADGKFTTAYCKLAAAWYVTDTNLRTEMLAFDKDGNEYLDASEIAAVTSWTIADKSFSMMRGLSYLSALETLELTNVTGGLWLFGSLEEYRQWTNPMPALKTLKIKNAEGVQLSYTHIALDQCPELETLHIDAFTSDSSLTKLDISTNTKLLITSEDNFYFPRSVTEIICNADQEAKVKTVMADRIFEGELKVTVAGE